MTNTNYSRMFRGRIRMSTCRIILITSLAWLLIDVIIIMKYTDTLGSGLFKRSNEYNVEVSDFIAFRFLYFFRGGNWIKFCTRFKVKTGSSFVHFLE
jgi:hypothetical protein